MIKFLYKGYTYMDKIKDFFRKIFNKELTQKQEQELINKIFKKIKESC